ncbi:hypothetical protein D3C71_1306590 [compost metagenome]
MPGARHGIRQVFRERQAIEPLPFHLIVGGDDAQQNLSAEQGEDQPEILGCCAHRGRQGQLVHKVEGGEAAVRRAVGAPDVELARIEPDQSADAAQQDDDRDQGPQQDGGRRLVPDQRLMRPVAGVGDGLARTLGRGRPGGPEVEGRDRMGVGVRQARVDGEGVVDP